MEMLVCNQLQRTVNVSLDSIEPQRRGPVVVEAATYHELASIPDRNDLC
jgi:hypothetical protein